MKQTIICISLAAMLLTGCSSPKNSHHPEIQSADSAAATVSTYTGTSVETVTTSGVSAEMTTSAAESVSSVYSSESITSPKNLVSTVISSSHPVSSSQTTSLTTETAASSAVSGIDAEMFSSALDGIHVSASRDSIIEKGNVNGQQYSLTINLSKWAKYTAPEQMVVLSRLFWECYPKMYARFSDLSKPPVDITLAIENEGYEVAWASGNLVHLHDQWLYQYPEDYDCITHELAHVIQNNWDDAFLEDSGYIERFADCCRYEYAMNNGQYNDKEWTLQTIEGESSRGTSVRFFVWLDYMYSDTDTDMIRKFFSVCRNGNIKSNAWKQAWQEVFSGTKLSGKMIDEVWEMYAASDFAYLSSNSDQGKLSELLKKYPIREKVKALSSNTSK